MRKLALVALCFLAGYVQSEARGLYPYYSCDKAYVEPEQVALSPDGIAIQLESGSLLTSALYKDEQGIYFKDFKRRGDCAEGKWECQVCHYCNPNYTLFCGICWN